MNYYAIRRHNFIWFSNMMIQIAFMSLATAMISQIHLTNPALQIHSQKKLQLISSVVVAYNKDSFQKWWFNLAFSITTGWIVRDISNCVFSKESLHCKVGRVLKWPIWVRSIQHSILCTRLLQKINKLRENLTYTSHQNKLEHSYFVNENH